MQRRDRDRLTIRGHDGEEIGVGDLVVTVRGSNDPGIVYAINEDENFGLTLEVDWLVWRTFSGGSSTSERGDDLELVSAVLKSSLPT